MPVTAKFDQEMRKSMRKMSIKFKNVVTILTSKGLFMSIFVAKGLQNYTKFAT